VFWIQILLDPELFGIKDPDSKLLLLDPFKIQVRILPFLTQSLEISLENESKSEEILQNHTNNSVKMFKFEVLALLCPKMNKKIGSGSEIPFFQFKDPDL